MNNQNMRFEPFPKIPRLSRPVVITEKIDGTNASVTIMDEQGRKLLTNEGLDILNEFGVNLYPEGMGEQWVVASSRKRWIKRGEDNFGFALWVYDHAEELIEGLGAGTHYGEWWGSGIQRGYGLPKGEKRFSLFNTGRWRKDGDQNGGLANAENLCPECCHVVPVIMTANELSSEEANHALSRLIEDGSYATPFMDPEGIMMYHRHSNQYFKKTIKDDDKGKEFGG